MKFRFKVLFLNLLLLTLALSAIVFFVMQHSTRQTEKSLLSGAVQENTILENTIQYELLAFLEREEGDNLPASITQYFEKSDTVRSFLSPDTALFCVYNDEMCYATDEENQPPASLWDSLENGYKSSMESRVNDSVFLFTASMSRLYNRPFYVITRRDVTETHKELREEAVFFSVLTALILFVTGLLLYIISRLVTRPMEKLTIVTDRFAEGDYSQRAHVTSNDEIGVLSEHFNHLADSVESHIDELGEMLHRRDQFVADFTHEIKTPMTSIIGYADTMRRMSLSEEDRQMSLDYIYSEGRRLESMSMKLFDLIYLKDHPIEAKPISAASLIVRAEKSTKPMLEKKKQTLEIECTDGQIWGDAELLQTVLVNLIDNARKASAEGAVIHISGQPDDIADEERYRITVADTGIGMSEDEVKHITDEFFMADKSRSRKEGGAGLGMSLVATILAGHNADLSIESNPGEGTSVTILFTSPESNDLRNPEAEKTGPGQTDETEAAEGKEDHR